MILAPSISSINPEGKTVSNIIPFDFEGRPVRTVTRDGDPWFVLADICRILEIDNPTRAASRLEDDEQCRLDTTLCQMKGANINSLASGTGNNVAVFINEMGLYNLVLRSDKPQAKPFKRWVTHEVLPAIRKTGGYIVASPEETPEELFLRAMNVLKATVDRQRAQLAIAAPKAEALDIIAEADGDRSFQETAKALQIRPCELLSWLETNRWIYRRNTTGIWLGHAAPTNAGHLRFTTTPRGNGLVSEQTKVTKRGLAKLATIFGQKNLVLNGDVS